MAYVNFANPNSGPLAAAIGWFDFTGVSLGANASLVLANSLPNGGAIRFSITNTAIVGNITFTGAVSPQRAGIPFGTTNYTGIAGRPLLDATPFSGGRATLTIDNLSVTNSSGVTINFGLVVAEAEGSVGGESWTWNTNGTSWNLIANIYGSLANISGIATNTVTWGGANPWPSPVVSSNSPTRIIGNDIENVNSAIALGVILTPVTVRKNITNRIFADDQFNLSIVGPQSSTTITAGAFLGIQSQQAFVYAENGGTYILSESMAAGSTSSLSQYIQTVSIVNSSQGGTTIPLGWTLGQPLTLAMGDNITLIVTNTPNNPYISSIKTVDKTIGAVEDILNYTIVLTNTSPNVATNVVFIDTIPNGSTFIPSSLAVNGSSFTGNPNPPTGLNLVSIPANSRTTINYQVLVNSTATNVTPLKNSSRTNYSYNTASITIPSVNSNSNIVTTTIVSAVLSSLKIVNKAYTNIGQILTYTIPIINTGNSTAYNIVFIDTIPNGTTLVPNSLVQDGVIISGTTLPRSIRALGISTITFKVIVSTLPSPNPIENTASYTYSYTVDLTTIPARIGVGSGTTNTVSTQVNNANLYGITKTVDKLYATCGEVLTYKIIIPNSGNVTAENIIFMDTIASGLSLVANSLTIDGVTKPSVNLNLGITIPSIAPGTISTITFKVVVNCI